VPLYLDSSALIKRYVDEPESQRCEQALLADPAWLTAGHTLIEVRRNLARRLRGAALKQAQSQFVTDWARIEVLDLDEQTRAAAAKIAERTGARTLDALHLGAAMRVEKLGLIFFTFDRRQAQAARSLGFRVEGVRA
jgi:uncharacterized protein